jgi:hypothetical protein
VLVSDIIMGSLVVSGALMVVVEVEVSVWFLK